MPYVELHASSAFSFLQGADLPETLHQQAAHLGLDALAILDRAGLYGSPRAHHAAQQLGTRAIVGAKIPLPDGLLPVLVASKKGYQQLCKLLSSTHLRSPKGEGLSSWAELEELGLRLDPGDWIILSGGFDGPVLRPLLHGRPDQARQNLARLVQTFGRHQVYVELQRHHLRSQALAEPLLHELATRFHLQLVATGGVQYATPQGRQLCDAFCCLRHGLTIDDASHLLSQNAQRFLRPDRAMRRLFADLPGAVDQSAHIASRITFTLDNLGYRFPEYPTPPGETMAGTLRRLTFEGAAGRYGPRLPTPVRSQLEHELAVIARLGFPGYFLIVADIVRFARSQGMLVQGRGSAANSAVCYALGITAVDPVGCGLLFERFLSDGRQGWPDIDLDLPSGPRRESVIQEVFRRYAPRGAAMTANVITFRGRSAMREMGKVLGFPDHCLKRFSDLYGHGDFPHTAELREHVLQAGFPPHHPRLAPLLQLYQATLGLPRHLGQHSGGMIISDQGLDHVVPLENASMPGRTVIQWDKEDCEDLGIVKVDLLGLGMLAAMEETVQLCTRRRRPVDLATIPKDDEATFDLLCDADTIGTFQVESRAQQATLPRMRPRCFYDVAIQVALIRPGPIVGKLVHPYLDRRNGRAPIDHIDPRFKPILERTLGVPLFQEQVLRMAMTIADFSGAEAEELRRAMSFHRSDERMRQVTTKLRSAMDQRHVAPETQEKIVAAISSFALYGFPESHAISFALIAYASAWLKAHRTVEFFTGLLNAQPMGFYSPDTLLRDARRHGIRTRPADVSASALDCQPVDDHTILLGLRSIAHLSRETAHRILDERQVAPFSHVADLVRRARPSPQERRALARSGALNSLAAHRREALWHSSAPTFEEPLFDWALRQGQPHPAASPSPLAPMTLPERFAADYETLGLTTGRHPMALLRPSLPQVTPAAHLARSAHGARLAIAGMVICRQRPGTAKGHLFLSLEDETGIANAFVPSALFEARRLTITEEPFLLVTGTLQKLDRVTSLYALTISPLPFAPHAHAPSHDFH